MKRLTLISALVLALGCSAFAQDAKSSWFVGFKSVLTPGGQTYGAVSFGTVIPLGKSLYSITDFNGGEGGSAAAEQIAVLFDLLPNFRAGFLAGLGAEWKPGGLPVDYGKGAAGALAVYDLGTSGKNYLWAAGKREGDLTTGNLWEAQWTIGLGLGVRI